MAKRQWTSSAWTYLQIGSPQAGTRAVQKMVARSIPAPSQATAALSACDVTAEVREISGHDFTSQGPSSPRRGSAGRSRSRPGGCRRGEAQHREPAALFCPSQDSLNRLPSPRNLDRNRLFSASAPYALLRYAVGTALVRCTACSSWLECCLIHRLGSRKGPAIRFFRARLPRLHSRRSAVRPPSREHGDRNWHEAHQLPPLPSSRAVDSARNCSHQCSGGG